jgi:hypothetical protein
MARIRLRVKIRVKGREHACLESGWLARLALVIDSEQKLGNYPNAHGLGV